MVVIGGGDWSEFNRRSFVHSFFLEQNLSGVTG